MNRSSYLVYRDARTDLETSQSLDGDVLYRSEHGVPLLWIFAFGGRNIWNPGDDVHARGGVVGKRNPYETSIEVASTRLEQALQVLPSAPYMWPWFSPMGMFARKLSTKPKAGYLRLVAPWMIGLEVHHFERWRSATAFAENATNLLGSGRFSEASRALAELREFCVLVPTGGPGDLERFGKSTFFPEESAEPVRLALHMLGVPDNPGPFAAGALRDVAGALAEYRKLPPAPVLPPVVVAGKVVVAEQPSATQSAGAALLKKLSGMFKR